MTINGTKTPTTAALSEVLAQLKPGDKVTVEILTTDGNKKAVAVTLGQLPG